MNAAKRVLLIERVNLEYKLAKYNKIIADTLSMTVVDVYTAKRNLVIEELSSIIKTLGTLLFIICINISGFSQNAYRAYFLHSGDTIHRIRIVDTDINEAKRKMKLLAQDCACTFTIKRVKKVNKNTKKDIRYE